MPGGASGNVDFERRTVCAASVVQGPNLPLLRSSSEPAFDYDVAKRAEGLN